MRELFPLLLSILAGAAIFILMPETARFWMSITIGVLAITLFLISLFRIFFQVAFSAIEKTRVAFRGAFIELPPDMLYAHGEVKYDTTDDTRRVQGRNRRATTEE